MSRSAFKKNMKTPEVTPLTPLTPPNGLALGNFSDWKTSLQNCPEMSQLLRKSMIIFHMGHKAKPKPVTDAMWNAPPQVEGAEEAPPLPFGLVAKRREQDYNQYDAEKSYESCFWILCGTISEESKNRFKILAGDRWMGLQTSCDTQLLFQLITESHHTHAFGDGDVNALLNVSALEAQMQALKQDDCSLSQFARKYRETRIACNAGGCPQTTEAADALYFMLKLNPFTYSNMLTEMKRKAARQDPDVYPRILNVVVAIAISWTPVEEVFVPYQALRTFANNEKSPKKDRKVDFADRKETALAAFQTEFQKREARLISWRQSDAGKLAISNYTCRNCGKKGHMSKECRSQRKPQVLATTSIDDGVTIDEYASYFDGDDEGQDYELEYNNDIANYSDGEVWQAFMMRTVNYETDGMSELVDASESDSDDEYDRKLASQREEKRSHSRSLERKQLLFLLMMICHH
jgi:hypothetical protein